MTRGTGLNDGMSSGGFTADEIVSRNAARGRVIVGSDGSSNAARAALHTAAEAVAHGTAFTIVHAPWICDDPFFPRRRLEEARQKRDHDE